MGSIEKGRRGVDEQTQRLPRFLLVLNTNIKKNFENKYVVDVLNEKHLNNRNNYIYIRKINRKI